MAAKHTNFVEFHDEELGSLGIEQSLSLVAVRAVGLGEDNYNTPDVSFCASLVTCLLSRASTYPRHSH